MSCNGTGEIQVTSV